MRIAAYTQGLTTPSARFRVRQHIPIWRHLGIETTELVGETYPPAQQIKRPLWLGFELGRRFRQVIAGRCADLSLLQREFISTLPTFERLTRRPRVLDIDDAVWLRQRFLSIDRLAAQCDLVICGNAWIADHFARFSRRIQIVPTGVDTTRFVPLAVPRPEPDHLVIGWVGTSSNFTCLESIQNALRIVLREIPSARLLIMADKPPLLPEIPPDRLVFRPWSASAEIDAFQSIDVGIMPLTDSVWTRGKCSFKLLQYLSCGIPGVASPVGMNVDVAASGGVLLAKSDTEWVESILGLLRDPPLRLQFGANGRANVENHYAATTIARRLAELFHEIAGVPKIVTNDQSVAHVRNPLASRS